MSTNTLTNKTWSKTEFAKFNPHFKTSHQTEFFTLGDDNLLKRHQKVWFTGTEHPSQNGIKNTQIFATSAVEHQATILTNLESGIDHIAHFQALKRQRPTIAWLASNLDQCYPVENDYLKSLTLIDHGLLISSHQQSFFNWDALTKRDCELAALADQIILPEVQITDHLIAALTIAAKFHTPVHFIEQTDPHINQTLIELNAQPLTSLN